MCALVKIYKLIDPRNGEIRYVGKTQSKYLCERLAVHVRQSKNVVGKPSHKEAWIKNVLADGLKPRIELICEVDEKDWAAEEIKQIAHHKEMGCRLTNTSIGGDAGNLGGHHSEQNRKLIRERMLGNKYSVGKKWTAEQREKMMVSRSNPWNKGKTWTLTHTKEHLAKMSLRMRGSNHPSAKLDTNKVIELRERRSRGEKPIELAKETGLSYAHVCKILKKRVWQHC